MDVDDRKIECVSAGRAPFCENQLQPIIREAVASGKLSATANLQQALAESSIAMICLNTDSSAEGGVDVSGVLQVIDCIAEAHRAGVFQGTVVLRSTVPPGTCEQLLMPRLRSSCLSLVANPEFLREGSSVMDFMDPSMIVIGGDNGEAIRCVSDLYSSLARDITIVGLREAEVIKHTCNALHALKIAFANEIDSLSSALGIDGERVMQVVCSDARLNTSAAYLKPGFAFGGYCLPKDTRTLNACATKLGVNLPLLRAILPSNSQHLQRAVDFVLELGVNPVGVYGISFKGGTDDLRESPALVLVRELVRRGLQVQIFDPMVNASPPSSEAMFIGEDIKHLMLPDFDKWLHDIHCAVLTRRVDPETMMRLQDSELPVLHLWQSSSLRHGLVRGGL